jgi:hypothetical protein
MEIEIRNEILGARKWIGHLYGWGLHGKSRKGSRLFGESGDSEEDCKGKRKGGESKGNRWSLLLRSRKTGKSGGEESPSSTGQGGP